MTIEHFKRLHEIEQEEIVSNFGSYITNFVQGDIMYDSYKLYRFYVVYTYDLRLNKTQTISSFRGDAEFLLRAGNSGPWHN